MFNFLHFQHEQQSSKNVSCPKCKHVKAFVPTQPCVVTVVSGEVVAEGAGEQDGGEVLQPGYGGAGVCHDQVGQN